MTFDGGANTLAAQNACSCVFSPVSPHFRRRCAPLKVSLWRRMSADATGMFILTKRQQAKPVFSSCSFFALKVRFRGAKTYYMNFFTFHYNS